MPRILVSSDEPILTAGLADVLRYAGEFEMLPACHNLAELLEALPRSAADLTLVDLTPEVTYQSLGAIKQAAAQSRIVLWTNTISTELAFGAMRLGVRGILRKTLPPEMHLKCLTLVCAGELWFEKSLVDGFISRPRGAELTQRETRLVSLLAQGLKNKEIAAHMMIAEGTVKVYLTRLFHKVGVKDRFELALFGLKNVPAARQPSDSGGPGPGARPTFRLGSLSRLSASLGEKADECFAASVGYVTT